MIAIGSDHGGFALKQEIIKHLEAAGYACKDYGTCSAYPRNDAAGFHMDHFMIILSLGTK